MERWPLDFIGDQIVDRRFEVLNVVNDHRRFCLQQIVDVRRQFPVQPSHRVEWSEWRKSIVGIVQYSEIASIILAGAG